LCDGAAASVGSRLAHVIKVIRQSVPAHTGRASASAST